MHKNCSHVFNVLTFSYARAFVTSDEYVLNSTYLVRWVSDTPRLNLFYEQVYQYTYEGTVARYLVHKKLSDGVKTLSRDQSHNFRKANNKRTSDD